MTGTSEIQLLESRRLLSVATIGGMIAMGNLNGDARADQAVIHRDLSARNITVELDLGTGRGIFIKSDSTTIANFTPTAVTIGDVNGDGAADVVMTGVAVTPSTAPTPFGRAASIITPIARPTNEVLILYGDGKGGFLRSSAGGAVRQDTININNLVSTSSVAVGDFDGNGFADIAVLGKAVGPSSTLSGFRSTSTAIDVKWDPEKPGLSPVLLDTLVVPPSNPNVNTLFVGDLNNDTHQDLVAVLDRQSYLPIAFPSAMIPIRPDLATVSFPKTHSPVVTVGVNPLDRPTPLAGAIPIFRNVTRTLGLAALSKGGPLDLVGLRGNSIIYSAYDPTSGFGAAQTAMQRNTPPALAFAQIQFGDIDGDGLPDLLAQTVGGAYFGRNTPSSTVGGVLFSWTHVILPPTLSSISQHASRRTAV